MFLPRITAITTDDEYCVKNVETNYNYCKINWFYNWIISIKTLFECWIWKKTEKNKFKNIKINEYWDECAVSYFKTFENFFKIMFLIENYWFIVNSDDW